jgi:DNA-binding response OmpR family regulator
MTQYGNVETVLLVEDNPDDVFLMQRAFKKARIKAQLLVVTDGEQAVSYLEGKGEYADRQLYPLPGLVFHDLKLPFLHGFVVLAWIRKQAYLNEVHVIILTSSMEDQDREKAAALGAPYLVKPPTPQMLLEAIRSLGLSLEPLEN